MEKIYIHPLPVRIWHWVNALGFLVLIATGIRSGIWIWCS